MDPKWATRGLPGPQRTRPAGGGARVLVVDDEPMVRDVVARCLERDGYAVDVAADGPQALEARSPDLVILDLMLPT